MDGRLNFKATLDDGEYMKKLDNMKKGVDGLTFEKPLKSIKELKNEIEEVNDVLNKNRKSLSELNSRISTTAPGALKNDLLKQRNSLKKSIQEDEVALKNINAELQRTRASYTTVNAELLKTRQQMAALALAGKQNTAEYQELSQKAKEYSNALKQVGNDTAEVSRKSIGLKGVFTTIASYFGVFTGIQTVISFIKDAFNTIIEFDSRLLNVSKTTGLAGQELKDLGVSLRLLSQELKVISVDKLMEFAGVAGQLGINGTQEILAFTEALAKLSTTSNIQGEEGAIQIARFLGLVEGDVKNVKDLGDELTNLGNNFKVFEDEIIKNALAIAQNTGAFKLGRQEILAYATTLKEAGVEAELTGASLGRTYQQIEKVLRTGKNIDNLAKITGQSVEDLKSSFDTDPQGVIYSFIRGLNEVYKAGGNVNNAITSIGITATRDLRVIGTLATGGFDVLNRAMNDVKDSSGAMQREFETASGKISNSIESVKVSWENFILAINSSENAIGSFVSEWMQGVSIIIDWITRLSTSWNALSKQAGIKNFNTGYSSVIKNKENISQDDALKRAFKEEEELRKLTKKKKELEDELKDITNRSLLGRSFARAKDTVGKELEEVSSQLGELMGRVQAYRDISNDINNSSKKTSSTINKSLDFNDSKSKKTDTLIKQRLAFLDELQKAERSLYQTTLTGLDLELAKVEEVYNERVKKAKELKASQEAFNKIESLRQRETEIVTFKSETDSIIAGLEAQKKDYEDFENFKKQVGVQKATEMYSDIIDVSKTYMQVLEDEMGKIDLSTATDLEKDRLNALFKIYQDYNIKKQEEDRKSIENLINTTISVTDKLRVLYEKYQSDLVDLSKRYTGERLKEEEEKLQKAFINESDKLSSEILGRADEFQMALEIIGASTRRQAQYQIDSLNKLLQSSNKLSDRQVSLIKKTIGELNKVLIAGDDGKQSDRIAQINKQIANTESEINRLQKLIEDSSKEDFETAEQFATRMKVISDAILVYKERLESLKQDKFLATIEEVSSLSAGFDSLGDSLGDFNEDLSRAFKTIGDILKIVGQVGKLIEEVGDGVRAAGEASGSSWVAIVGAVVQIAGTVVNMISQAKKAREQARAEYRAFYENLTTAEYEYQQLIRQRRLAAIEANQDISSYEKLKQQEEELRKQLINSANEYQELMTTIMQEGRYISDLERDKKKNKEIYGDFSGITGDIEEQYAQLEKMFLEGRLEGQTLKWFEALRTSKEELESLGYSLEDVIRIQNELVTGTSWSQMSSQIADMFASGTNSAVEFANTMEDLIKNAIVAGFKARFIDEAMQGLFDQLAGFANDEDGLTQSEIDEFNRLAQEAIGGLNNQWQQLIDGLDLDFNSDDLGGSVKDGIKRITETQADRLTGILTGMQMDVIASRQILTTNRNLLSSSLDNLIMIEVNTRQTADNTYQLVQIMQNNQQQSLGL